MLPADAAGRKAMLAVIHRIVEATEPPTGERARRLAQIEAMFAGGGAAELPAKAPRRIGASASSTPAARKSGAKARPTRPAMS
jgi:hypothetical protein